MILAAIIIPLSILWVVFESVTLLSRGLYHFIKRNGTEMIKEELSDCWLNNLDTSIICLRNKSQLKGSYITTTKTSIISPYYISDLNNKDYGILIFSKSYFLVKEKFKQLNANKARRIKFK